MAPEALEKRRYSEKSDVWAFAVLAWELLVSCKVPYFELTSDKQVITEVVGGGRLAMPRCVSFRYKGNSLGKN